MKPAKRYASPASAVPDISIIRAPWKPFRKPRSLPASLLSPLVCSRGHPFGLSQTTNTCFVDFWWPFTEHVNCDPDNECVSRSSWRLLKCTCLNKMFLFIWSKYVWIWFAFETNDLRCGNARYLNNRKHMRKLNIRNSRTSGACWATLDEICLLSENAS